MTTITISKNRHKESSIIDDFNYNPETKVLIVKFKGSKTHRYQYQNIEEELFEEICDANSLGSAFLSKIASNPKFKHEIIK